MIKRFIALFIAVLIADGAAAQTINNLAPGVAVQGTDIFPAYQGANPATAITATQLKTYISPTAAPCSAFGRTSGTCAQGNLPGDVTAATTPGAGNIGEVLSFSNTAQAITTGTVTNTLSGPVTAGHWRCDGAIFTNPAAGTTQSTVVVAATINATPTFPSVAPEAVTAAAAAGQTVAITSGPWFFNFTTTTNVFVTADVNYAVSTLTISSSLSCQRIF